jgi:hypothetical protein
MTLLDTVAALAANFLEVSSHFGTALQQVADGWTSALSLSNHPLLLAAADSIWEKRPFQKPIWTGIMFGLRVALAVIGAMLVIYEVRAWRMGEPVRERTKKRIALLFTVLAFGAYFDFGNPNVRYREYYHRHELYHYYLGSKYFAEVGYQRLYDCTLIAEIDNGRKSQVMKREFRDLRVNLIKKVENTYILTEPERCKKHFTTERWEAFKKDIDWFYNSSRGSYWDRMQQDHGYNPPPVWTMTGKAIASLAPAGDGFFKALAALDVILQIGMVVAIYWAFGWRTGAISAIFWGTNAAANFYWTGGAFLRQDWLFLMVLAVCLARKRFFFWAGAALMWSALLRVFPGALFGGWAMMVLIYVIQRVRGRPPAPGDRGILSYIDPSHRRLIAGAVLAAAVLIPTSMATTGGVQPWIDFKHHIGVHKKTPLTNHMGLPTMLSHTWESRMRFTRDNNLEDAFEHWKTGRNDRKESRQFIQYGIFLTMWLWIGWALHRSRLLWLAPPLSLPLVMCLTDLTCYYYSMFIIAGVLASARKPIGITLLATAASSVVLLGRDIGYADVGLSGFYFVDDNFTAQSYIFFLFCILMLWSYSRPLNKASLLAFWNRKPPVVRPKHEPDENPTTVAGV